MKIFKSWFNKSFENKPVGTLLLNTHLSVGDTITYPLRLKIEGDILMESILEFGIVEIVDSKTVHVKIIEKQS